METDGLYNYSHFHFIPHVLVGNNFQFQEMETSTPGRIEPDEQGGGGGGGGGGKDTVWYLRVWLFGAGGATVACLGIVCNVITIAVLINFRSKSSAPFLLSCLALSDTIRLLFLLVLENLTQLAKHAVIDPSYNGSLIVQALYSKMWSVHFVTQTLSVYIVTVITLERYVVVCWPFKAKTICRLASARVAMLVVLVFALLINLPHYMAYHSGWVWRNDTQTDQFYFIRTSFGSSYFFQEIFYKWMQMAFNFIIPLTVLLSFNTLSIMGLRRNMAIAFGNTNRRECENKLTVMIVCMTAIFFFCELLAAIGHVLVSGYNSYSEVHDIVNGFVAVSDFLMMVNAAVNFAIYCVTGRKFRETFNKMFIPTRSRCCRRCSCTNQLQPRGANNNSSTSTCSKLSTSDTKRTALSSTDDNIITSRQVVFLREGGTDDNKSTNVMIPNEPLLNKSEMTNA